MIRRGLLNIMVDATGLINELVPRRATESVVKPVWAYRTMDVISSWPERQVQTTRDRGALTQMVIRLFDHWALPVADQVALLGLGQRGGAVLTRYRTGQAIGASRDQTDRVAHLLAIHRRLRILFPHNRELGYRWMSTRNRAFNNVTPVELVKDWGLVGLLRVRTYLERSQ